MWLLETVNQMRACDIKPISAKTSALPFQVAVWMFLLVTVTWAKLVGSDNSHEAHKYQVCRVKIWKDRELNGNR